MKRKFLLFVAILAALCCFFAISVCAAEPSSSDGFGEITLITDNDTIAAKNDFGYAEGDTARIVVQVPGTQTYLTYPAYYFLGEKNDGNNGYQPVFDATAMANATGLAYDATCVIRLEIPDVFTGISTNYTKTNTLTSLKYVKLGSGMWKVHSSAFKGLASLEEVVFEDNLTEGAECYTYNYAFQGCSNLNSVTLPVHLVSLGEATFKNCTSLTEIDIPDNVTSIGCACFYSCTALANVNFTDNSKLATIVSQAFQNCSSLTGTFELKNVTKIGSDAFNAAGTNEGCYLVFKLPNVETLGDYTDRDVRVFYNAAGIKEIYIGDKLNAIGINTFSRCTGLWICEIKGVSDTFTSFTQYTFDECSSLKAFSFPEGIEVIYNRVFRNCTSLKAVYLPSTLTQIASGYQDHSTFKSCTNMYFVNEPFTFTGDSDIPEKPDVYYFPENMTSFPDGSEPFKDCQSLNKTLVFGELVTRINNSYAFYASSSTLENVVFLGDMENVSTTKTDKSYWVFKDSNSKIYFANENDKSLSDVSMNCLDSRAVFCYAEGNTVHLKKLTKSTEATCLLPKMTADYCYCGQYIPGTEQTEGEALGHDYDGGEVSYVFTSLTEGGKKCTACLNNCGIDIVEALSPIVVDMGYSVKTFGQSGYTFTNGYIVDNELLKRYEEAKGVTVTIGIAFNAADSFTADEVTLESFAVKTDIEIKTNGTQYGAIQYAINYEDGTYLDTDLIITAYVIEGDTLSFLNRGDVTTGVNGFEAVDYYLAKSKSPQ